MRGFEDVIWSPILVNDLADYLLRMMELNLTGIYHVAGTEACSKFQFGRRLAQEFGLDGDLIVPTSIDDIDLKAKRPKDTSLKCDKAYAALQKSMPDVSSGLRRFKGLRDSGYVTILKSLKGG